METASASQKSKPFFRHDPVVSVVLLLGIFFSSQIVAGFLISLYPAVRSWTQAQSLQWLTQSVAAQFGYVLMAEALAVGMVLKALRYAKVLYARIGLIRPRPSDVMWAFTAYALYFITYAVVVTVVSNLLPQINTTQEQQIGFETARSTGELGLVFISLVVLPPIAEEIMFRGFLFSGLRAKYRFWPAAIVTSILFGIAHLQFGADAPLLWVAAIDTFILGCFLAYLRDKTGSLWPPMCLHAIKNCVAFLILFGPRFLS